MTDATRAVAAVGNDLRALVDALGNETFGHALTQFAHDRIDTDFIAINLHAGNYALLHRIGELSETQRTIVDTVDRHATFRFDPNSDLVQQLRTEPRRSLVSRVNFGAQSNKRYHNLFYERFQLIDRISVITRRDPGWLVSSFYRTAASGPFDDDEAHLVTALGEVVNAFAIKHLDRFARGALASANPGAIATALTIAELPLSRREIDVSAQLLAGADNVVAATRLGVATETVRTLRRRIYQKLDVHDLAGLMRTVLAGGQSSRL